jgi:hypothetical protein
VDRGAPRFSFVTRRRRCRLVSCARRRGDLGHARERGGMQRRAALRSSSPGTAARSSPSTGAWRPELVDADLAVGVAVGGSPRRDANDRARRRARPGLDGAGRAAAEWSYAYAAARRAPVPGDVRAETGQVLSASTSTAGSGEGGSEGRVAPRRPAIRSFGPSEAAPLPCPTARGTKRSARSSPSSGADLRAAPPPALGPGATAKRRAGEPEAALRRTSCQLPSRAAAAARAVHRGAGVVAREHGGVALVGDANAVRAVPAGAVVALCESAHAALSAASANAVAGRARGR